MLKTWEGIKSIIHINTNNNKSINSLNVNDIEETDPFVLNSSFNKFSQQLPKKQNPTLSTHLKTTQIILQAHQRKLSP